MIRRIALVAVVALSIEAAACSSSPSASQPTTPTTTTTTPPATTAVPLPITTSTGEIAQAVSGSPCDVSGIRISAGIAQGAAGNAGQTIVFTNVGRSPCVIGGYPGVAALSAQGSQLAQAQRKPTGMMGGLLPNSGPLLPVTTLAPGRSASAEIEGSDVAPQGVTTCATYPAFLVTPPGDTQSVKVTLAAGEAFPGCVPISVNPVVPGTTGRVQ